MTNFFRGLTLVVRLLLEILMISTIADAIVASQTKFLSKLWEAQSRPASQGLVIEDPSISSVFAEMVEHLHYCERTEGFGDTSAFTAVAGHIGEEILFPGAEARKEKVPYSAVNEEVLRESMLWCRAMISDFSVCPFTIDEVEAGIPKGKIRYTMSSATTIEETFRDFWDEMTAVLENSNEDVATVLLMYGEESLFLHDIELFEAFTACLDDCLKHKALGIAEEMQLVYFHPEFQFRDKDGQNQIVFADDGTPLGMSSDIVNPIDYSRRAPYPTINILRAPQVNKVQNGVPVGQIFHNNVKNLNSVGTDRLEAMLKARDWSDLPVISSHAKRRQKASPGTTTATSGSVDAHYRAESEALEQVQVDAVVEYLAQSEKDRGETSTGAGAGASDAEIGVGAGVEWVEYKTDEGRPYYHDPVSGEVAWERPQQQQDLQWVEYRTEEGRPYYHNPATGEVAWQRP